MENNIKSDIKYALSVMEKFDLVVVEQPDGNWSVDGDIWSTTELISESEILEKQL